jgi:hypothetical protein
MDEQKNLEKSQLSQKLILCFKFAGCVEEVYLHKIAKFLAEKLCSQNYDGSCKKFEKCN